MGITHAAKAGSKLTGAEWESASTHVVSGLGLAFIGCRAIRSSTQTVSGATWTVLDFTGTDTFDTDGFHDPGTNPSRLTVPAGMGGKYLVTGNVIWGSSSSGGRYLAFSVNGTRIINMARSTGVSGDLSGYDGTDIVDLAAGDYVELQVWQNSGGNLDIQSGTYISLAKLDSGKVGQGIGAKAYNSATQNSSNATVAALTLDTESFDTDGFHSTVTNTSRMTIPTGLAGKYLVIGATTIAPNATGQRIVAIFKNGATVGGHQEAQGNGTNTTRLSTSVVLDLVVGDYVEAIAYQDSGSTLAVGNATFDLSTQLSIMRLDSGSSSLGQHCMVYRNTNLSVSGSTFTSVPWDGEEEDTDGFHDTGSNTDRITIPTGLGGLYLVTGTVTFASNSSNERIAWLAKNSVAGSTWELERRNADTVFDTTFSFSRTVRLVAGDYLTLTVYQSTGGAINLYGSGGSARTAMAVTRIAA